MCERLSAILRGRMPCMIVRDEADSIQRCIESVAPYITRWAIVDTGSIGRNGNRAKKALGNLPGNGSP